MDLKAAFDLVDREVLVGTMRECGIREGLTVRVKQVIRETKSRVRIGKEIGESFWTARGVEEIKVGGDVFEIDVGGGGENAMILD